METANKNPVEQLLTVRETCELLKISVPTFYRFRNDGKLKCVRVGKHLRIEPAELRSFIARNVTERTGDQ